MCGRYTIYHGEDELQDLLGVLNAGAWALEPHYNIAPTALVPIVFLSRAGERLAGRARWGLVPRWVDDPAAWRASTFNARSEEAAGKPAFREAFRRGRVLIPASGFYEWQRGTKVPHHIRLGGGEPFAFAGLMDVWRSRDGARRLVSCTILTTRANDRLAGLHHRMPVIVRPDEYGAWLDREVPPEELGEILQPFPDEAVEAYPVSTDVNSGRGNSPSFIEELPGATA